jgi:hypothetical protein
MSEMLGLWPNLIKAARPESPSMEILDQLHWSPEWRGTI